MRKKVSEDGEVTFHHLLNMWGMTPCFIQNTNCMLPPWDGEETSLSICCRQASLTWASHELDGTPNHSTTKVHQAQLGFSSPAYDWGKCKASRHYVFWYPWLKYRWLPIFMNVEPRIWKYPFDNARRGWWSQHLKMGKWSLVTYLSSLGMTLPFIHNKKWMLPH